MDSERVKKFTEESDRSIREIESLQGRFALVILGWGVVGVSVKSVEGWIAWGIAVCASMLWAIRYPGHGFRRRLTVILLFVISIAVLLVQPFS